MLWMKNIQIEVSQKHLGVPLGGCVNLKLKNNVIKHQLGIYYSIL